MFKKILTLLIISFSTLIPTQAMDLSSLSGMQSMGLLAGGGLLGSQEYNIEIAKKIINNFELPNTNEDFTTIVMFRIDLNGSLIDYKIQQSSGNDDYDERVIQAVKISAPYPIPKAENAQEVVAVLNMNLSIIKLIKMLSGQPNLDMNLPIGQPIIPEDMQKQLQQLQQLQQPQTGEQYKDTQETQNPKHKETTSPKTKTPTGMKFINIEDLENTENLENLDDL